MSNDLVNDFLNGLNDADGKINKKIVFVLLLLLVFALFVIYSTYVHNGITTAVIIAIFIIIAFPGGFIATRKRYFKRLEWYLRAYLAIVVWILVLLLFIDSINSYRAGKILIQPLGGTGFITLPSHHLSRIGFKKNDRLAIWSRGSFYLLPNINPKESFLDSIQGNKKFSTYLEVIWPEKVPENYRKMNKTLDKHMRAMFPGFQFGVSPYQESEALSFKILKDIECINVLKYSDSLFMTSSRNSFPLIFSDFDFLQITLELILIFGLFGIAYLVYRARVEPKDELTEDKKQKKIKSQKIYHDEQEEVFGNNETAASLKKEDFDSSLPIPVAEELARANNMLLNIFSDFDKIQSKQNSLTSISGSVIMTDWILYKDELLKRLKEAKIADVAQIRRLVQELIYLRDKTRELSTSDMKDKVEILRQKIEIAKLNNELFRLLPKSEEDTRKERIMIRYTPLLRRYKLESEAQLLMFQKSSPDELERDLEKMLIDSGWSPKDKDETEKEKDEILKWVRIEKAKLSYGIDLALHKAELAAKIKKTLKKKHPQDTDVVDSIMDDVNRILFEEAK